MANELVVHFMATSATTTAVAATTIAKAIAFAAAMLLLPFVPCLLLQIHSNGDL